MNTNFQGKEVPKENASYKCLSLIVLGSIIRVSKKYYLQTLLEQYKYVIRKNKMENLINDDLDLSSSDKRLIMNLIAMNLVIKAKTVF